MKTGSDERTSWTPQESSIPRDPESLIDIEIATRRILRYTNGIDRTELEVNDEKISAILYQITIIGEAARRISIEFQDQHPEIL